MDKISIQLRNLFNVLLLVASALSFVTGLAYGEWARPDLDWRPPGYQPGAPTGLSYGPAGPRKTRGRLKRSLTANDLARFYAEL